MKKTLKFSAFFLPFMALAAGEVGMIESKVQTDLDQMLSRFMRKEQYLVQVSVSSETVREKKLMEGEQIVSTPAADTSIQVPPLPGFTVPTRMQPKTAPSQTRQVFTTVEKEVLKSISVNITVDDDVKEEMAKKAQSMAQRYLSSNYGSKAGLSFSRVKMISPEGDSFLGLDSSLLARVLVWTVFGLLALGVCVWLLKSLRRPKTVYPTMATREYRNEEELRDEDVSPVDSPAKGLGYHPVNAGNPGLPRPQLSGPMALPSGKQVGEGKYPPLPATSAFVDRRAELLEFFFKHAEVFRIYFGKLPQASQLELYAGLRGPAFDNFLDALELSIPAEGDTMAPPSEDQMIFYNKNFDEFIRAHAWQDQQFFGFLQRLTDEQLLTLVKNENALVAAVMLKFLKPRQSASILDELSSEKRLEILSQFARTKDISTTELNSIEATVRAQMASLPKFIWGSSKVDGAYWAGVLAQSHNQEGILQDLEESRPDLYPLLAKFRFKLEDAPSLPMPLITKILDEVDNDELTKAMLTCPKDTTQFLLGQIHVNRRTLIESQLVSFAGLPVSQLQESKQKITQRFREVMV